MVRGSTVALLFTDVVDSTELLSRAGDEAAQRVFAEHRRLLQGVVGDHRGREVKWLGDGLMVTFDSAADAVRASVVMQQESTGLVAGEHLAIRVGVHVGEALLDEDDLFGTPVVVARRLCDRAGPGQIFCSGLVRDLLAGRSSFAFESVGDLELKGLASPVATWAVRYNAVSPRQMVIRAPFVGRSSELSRLSARLDQAVRGHGGLVMVAGEPGVGKTRLVDEFLARSEAMGIGVMRGRCFEGESGLAYEPFVEAIESYANACSLDMLREDLGASAPVLARLAIKLRELMPDVGEPMSLPPDEERLRLFDAVAQFFIRVGARAPVVVVLDDLHWAERATVALLRYVCRFLEMSHVLVIGAYRDVELDRLHPLAAALGMLRREVDYERIAVKGLEERDVAELLSAISEKAADTLVRALATETDGNPFFIREVLLHLLETRGTNPHDGWLSVSLTEVGIPEGVRDVIGRRLSRLSADANHLLTCASGVDGPFQLRVASQVAELADAEALDALDEALDAQILTAAEAVDEYDFTHALIRHTLYEELNPSRQVRLHRSLAEAIETCSPERVAAIADQYRRSAVLPGAERGVSSALEAAGAAEDAFAFDEAASFLRLALELATDDDARRPRVLARLGLALARSLDVDEAAPILHKAGDNLSVTESDAAAAEFFAEAADAAHSAGATTTGWDLARRGLQYVGQRRDLTWARLRSLDLTREEALDPDFPGIALDSPERRQVSELLGYYPNPLWGGPGRSPTSLYATRAEVLDEGEPFTLLFWAGAFSTALPGLIDLATSAEEHGAIGPATLLWSAASRCHLSLGELPTASEVLQHASDLASRMIGPSGWYLNYITALYEYCVARDDGWDELNAASNRAANATTVEARWALAPWQAGTAYVLSRTGHPRGALRFLQACLPGIERAPGWAPNYTSMVHDAARTLWYLRSTDHIEIIERNLRDKTITPDLRYPMKDARLALACLCALQNRVDEAIDLFEQARTVLDNDGPIPLRPICDFDEALMWMHLDEPAKARTLINTAHKRFTELGMYGWTQRAEELSARVTNQ
jgi:class 3 adenylate cyclase/tetratricopeptide (TPR) repeat protein